MDISKTVVDAVRAYVLAGRLHKRDFQFSVEAAGHTWDVYRIHIGDLSGQLAFYLENGFSIIGYFGPGNRKPEEMQELLTHGLPWRLPDA